MEKFPDGSGSGHTNIMLASNTKVGFLITSLQKSNIDLEPDT